jgi:peroxiredoxin
MLLAKKIAGYAVIAVALAIVAVFVMPSYRQGEASMAGRPARELAIQLNGKPAHLSDLKGKVVVLNFWATWCRPCVEEMPALNGLQKRIASRGGVVLGVSMDEDEAAYQRFLNENGIDFATYRDPSKQSALDYGTAMYPETYVIDRHGKIARKVIGPQQWESAEMLAYFDALLAQN